MPKKISEADLKAMEELACELPYDEAVKFIRAETGCYARTAEYLADSLAEEYPGTVLGKDYYRFQAELANSGFKTF